MKKWQGNIEAILLQYLMLYGHINNYDYSSLTDTLIVHYQSSSFQPIQNP